MRFFALILIALLLSGANGIAQHQEHDQNESHSSEHVECHGFRAATFIGHTLIPGPNNKKHFFIPSWGFDLEYWFSEKIGVGWHNDIELASFVVQGPGEEELEREYPIISTLDFLYKTKQNIVFLAGVGYEFEKEVDFFIFRFGAEMELPIDHNWDLFPTAFIDTATGERQYYTLTLGLGVGKHF